MEAKNSRRIHMLIPSLSGNPWHSKATELVNSFRAKASPDVVMASLESFKREIVDPVDVTMADDTKPTVASDAQADIVVRDLSTQALLHVGSRSFSHFLNIVER
jgi:nuclear cap-binding protein subunit 1